MRHANGAAIGVSVAAAAVHYRGLAAGFVYDDYRYLHRAQISRPLLGTTPLGVFRPLLELWFFVWWKLVGNQPVAFHAATLALIGTATYLMFRLAARVLHDDFGALCAAAFFGCHTALEWASTWTCLVQSALMLTLALGAVLLSLRVDRARYLAAPLGLGAMLTRETAVVLPILVALIALADAPGAKKALRSATPVAIALIPYALFRLVEGATSSPSGPYEAAFGRNLVDNFRQLAQLTAEPVGQMPIGAWTVAFWTIVVVLAVNSRHLRVAMVAGLWWLVAIAPVSTQLRPMFPYYLDLALPAAALLVGAAVSRLLELVRAKTLITAAIVVGTVVFGVHAALRTMQGSFVESYQARSNELLVQQPNGGELLVRGSRPLDAEITRDGDMWRVESDQPDLVVRFDTPQLPTSGL
jgi:hypothetical protein